MAGAGSAVIGLASEQNRKIETAVLQDTAKYGGQTLSLGEQNSDVTFASGLPETARNVLYLPVLQLIAYHRAIAKNLNPDKPHNLEMVVKLNWEE
jgi:glucosamine--fructose-6-phosphate aminotransferase (isomerizing)